MEINFKYFFEFIVELPVPIIKTAVPPGPPINNKGRSCTKHVDKILGNIYPRTIIPSPYVDTFIK